MSFKIYFLIASIASVLLFVACEDRKKASEEKVQMVKTTSEDTTVVAENSEEKKQKTENEYPKITNDNAVAFLTEYGAENPETKVAIETKFGTIVIELFEDTPLHRANFIYLVKQHYFDDTFFHRVVSNFIIQGGNSDTRATPKKRAALGGDYLIPAELKNGRKHGYGTVSGAKEYRENPDKKSAPFEFFIFLGPQRSTGHLNGNYTIFGKVIKGMDVVDKIAKEPVDEGDWPLVNVYINAKVIE
jgi:peptidylprolyl isomerase